MLTEDQAQEIVHESIKRTLDSTTVSPEQKLDDAGITPANLETLVKTIAANTKIGVPRYQHYIDPNVIAELELTTTTIKDLTDKILKLSAGKMCSNPTTPHPQKCCPYPANCPQCGFPVR